MFHNIIGITIIENKKASIGVVGLTVMGENLVLNMERNGFTVAVFNRTVSSVDNFAQGREKNTNIIPAHSLEEFVASIERPRCVMLMIKAGSVVDSMINALEAGVPLTLVTESVFARCLSADKEKREECEKIFSSNIGAGQTALEKAGSAFAVQEVAKQAADKTAGNEGFNAAAIKKLHDALYAAKIISYAQGFELMQKAGEQYDWQLDLGNIAMLWRGGCIIRSVFLQKIKDAYERKADLKNLVMDPYFSDILNKAHMSLRETVSSAAMSGIPVPSLSAALSWFDGIRCNDLPANLLQAQRDYFGAHTYERKDKKRGEFFHTDWTGHGGNTSSTTYNI